jgi:DNA-binding NtrC family response regulator
MLKGSVLVVGDDQSFRTYITSLLCSRGYEGEALATGDQLIGRLSSGVQPSVILLDMLLPDGDGIEVIRKIQAMGVNVPVIMLSEAPEIRTVVEATKLGAVDFLQKAFDDSALEQAIENAVGNSSREHVFDPATREPAEQAGQFVTRNAKMRRLADIIKRAARTDVPILILGESGVGKEVLARYAHLHSGRGKAFVKVNCAALPDELLESELFGYERGAFTGAVTDKEGKFEQAHTGTLLLDEIGEMSPHLQSKLLHVLQDGVFTRLGAQKKTPVDVRIIASTNINIEKGIAEGKFREDLYFRLNVISVELPPLRERREDIPALCEYFITQYRDRYHSKVERLPDELLNRFVQYDWPGNIRELENFIKRFLVLPDHHGLLAEFGSPTKALVSLLAIGADASDRVEQQLVQRVLEETHGNRTQAARRMNISYNALLNKLKRWAGTSAPQIDAEVTMIKSAAV